MQNAGRIGMKRRTLKCKEAICTYMKECEKLLKLVQMKVSNMYKLSYINDNMLSLSAREKVWFSYMCKLPKVY